MQQPKTMKTDGNSGKHPQAEEEEGSSASHGHPTTTPLDNLPLSPVTVEKLIERYAAKPRDKRERIFEYRGHEVRIAPATARVGELCCRIVDFRPAQNRRRVGIYGKHDFTLLERVAWWFEEKFGEYNTPSSREQETQLQLELPAYFEYREHKVKMAQAVDQPHVYALTRRGNVIRKVAAPTLRILCANVDEIIDEAVGGGAVAEVDAKPRLTPGRVAKLAQAAARDQVAATNTSEDGGTSSDNTDCKTPAAYVPMDYRSPRVAAVAKPQKELEIAAALDDQESAFKQVERKFRFRRHTIKVGTVKSSGIRDGWVYCTISGPSALGYVCTQAGTNLSAGGKIISAHAVPFSLAGAASGGGSCSGAVGVGGEEEASLRGGAGESRCAASEGAGGEHGAKTRLSDTGRSEVVGAGPVSSCAGTPTGTTATTGTGLKQGRKYKQFFRADEQSLCQAINDFFFLPVGSEERLTPAKMGRLIAHYQENAPTEKKMSAATDR
eukprot:g11165.t1